MFHLRIYKSSGKKPFIRNKDLLFSEKSTVSAMSKDKTPETTETVEMEIDQKPKKYQVNSFNPSTFVSLPKVLSDNSKSKGQEKDILETLSAMRKDKTPEKTETAKMKIEQKPKKYQSQDKNPNKVISKSISNKSASTISLRDHPSPKPPDNVLDKLIDREINLLRFDLSLRQ